VLSRSPLQAVFTCGVPGAGKTYVLDRVFGFWGDRCVLDLDDEIKLHPAYDPTRAHEIYASREAYEWADARVGRRFEEALQAHVARRLIVYDGTGTKVATRIGRIEQARAAGYVTSLLYVRVSLATALERNCTRMRCVPEDVLREYYARIEKSYELLKPHVDFFHVVENDGPIVDGEEEAISLPHSATEGVRCLTPLRSIPAAVLEEALEQIESGEGNPVGHRLERSRDSHGQVIVPLGYGNDSES
jgi:predicted kinase